MADVKWRPYAETEFREIIEYIARDSEITAKNVAQEIVTMSKSLPDQPYVGAMVPEYEINNLRERLVCGYRLIYRIRKSAIEIVKVIRASRPLPRKPPI